VISDYLSRERASENYPVTSVSPRRVEAQNYLLLNSLQDCVISDPPSRESASEYYSELSVSVRRVEAQLMYFPMTCKLA